MGKKRKTQKPIKANPNLNPTPQQSISSCYEGDELDDLLNNLRRSIKLAKASNGEQLPDKIWMKQQFAIGVNDVTRVLERMSERQNFADNDSIKRPLRRAPLVPLQAILLASDCNPRSLTKHIPNLASSRNVPIISIKDNRRGSIRLGELVNLKTAMAIGVKLRGSSMNTAVNEHI